MLTRRLLLPWVLVLLGCSSEASLGNPNGTNQDGGGDVASDAEPPEAGADSTLPVGDFNEACCPEPLDPACTAGTCRAGLDCVVIPGGPVSDQGICTELCADGCPMVAGVPAGCKYDVCLYRCMAGNCAPSGCLPGEQCPSPELTCRVSLDSDVCLPF